MTVELWDDDKHARQQATQIEVRSGAVDLVDLDIDDGIWLHPEWDIQGGLL